MSAAKLAREIAVDIVRNAEDAEATVSVCGVLVSTRRSAASPAKAIAADIARNVADRRIG
jgi:hypothetical protein